ncbi:hypothetical protein C5C31_07545 [Rathayibacter rathayi]|nr:hypothetical protein C5C31_07545 [Rathayibacter rathayi]
MSRPASPPPTGRRRSRASSARCWRACWCTPTSTAGCSAEARPAPCRSRSSRSSPNGSSPFHPSPNAHRAEATTRVSSASPFSSPPAPSGWSSAGSWTATPAARPREPPRTSLSSSSPEWPRSGSPPCTPRSRRIMATSPLRRAVNPRLVVVFAAIALIPLIYAGLLTSANLDPSHHLGTVPAAIVNEDTGATAADGSTLALGHDLADELTTSTSDSNFAWTATGADEAAHELASGDVFAVLTVPAGFSTDVASVGGTDPSAAVQAKLSIETNDGANLVVGTIASTIGTTVTKTLEERWARPTSRTCTSASPTSTPAWNRRPTEPHTWRTAPARPRPAPPSWSSGSRSCGTGRHGWRPAPTPSARVPGRRRPGRPPSRPGFGRSRAGRRR